MRYPFPACGFVTEQVAVSIYISGVAGRALFKPLVVDHRHHLMLVPFIGNESVGIAVKIEILYRVFHEVNPQVKAGSWAGGLKGVDVLFAEGRYLGLDGRRDHDHQHENT